jgi:cell division protein FtsI (penicillin-binding protein 3)
MPNIKRSILNRIFFSFTCIVAFSILVIYYIVNIQLVDGAKWIALSDSLTLKYKEIQAVRGNIYSDNGTLLATSVPIYELRMDLTVIPEDTFRYYFPLLSSKFSQKFKDKSAVAYFQDFKKAKASKNRYYLVKSRLNYLDIKEIKSWPLYKKSRFKSGLIIVENNYRVMPFKNLLERTIGYSSALSGKKPVGIEGAFNKELSGISGKRLVQKIAGGYRPVNDDNELEPIDGKDIYTTIDINFQDIVNDALLNGVSMHNAHHGCAVIMDVKSGEIKAMANLTKMENGSYKEIYNYVFGESFEPGSTFKLVSALALFENEKIELSDSVLINYGAYTIGGKSMVDAEISMFKRKSFAFAFHHSSNVGISTTVLNSFKNDPKIFTNYIKTLNLDKPIGLELPGEAKPKLNSPGSKNWSKMSLPWMSIGYEVRVTPIQILSIYNAVANEGKLIKPFIVKAIGNKGDIETEFKTSILNKEIANEKSIAKIKQLLEGVVDSGTAKKAFLNSRIKVAGKTGTAQIAGKNGYIKGAYNASFAGYFPSDNPKYSIVIVVNNPSGKSYYGGDVAAPIARIIAEKISGINDEIGVSLPDSLNQMTSFPALLKGNKSNITDFVNKFTQFDYTSNGKTKNWIMAQRNQEGEYEYNEINDQKQLVPDLSGMGLRDAIVCIENKKFKCKATGIGKVYWQSIKAGSEIKAGSLIYLKLKL